MIGASVVLSESLLPAENPPQLELSNSGPDKIPRKPLGRTQERASIIGLGGYSLADAPSLKDAILIAHEAIDAGVNFFKQINHGLHGDHGSEPDQRPSACHCSSAELGRQ
jgi:hypothetical protein